MPTDASTRCAAWSFCDVAQRSDARVEGRSEFDVARYATVRASRETSLFAVAPRPIRA
jgi:hypothetical protein